jgi:hypothetical protein
MYHDSIPIEVPDGKPNKDEVQQLSAQEGANVPFPTPNRMFAVPYPKLAGRKACDAFPINISDDSLIRQFSNTVQHGLGKRAVPQSQNDAHAANAIAGHYEVLDATNYGMDTVIILFGVGRVRLPVPCHPILEGICLSRLPAGTLMGMQSRTLMGMQSRTLMGMQSRTLMGMQSRTLMGMQSRTSMGMQSRTSMGMQSRTLMGMQLRTLMGMQSRTSPRTLQQMAMLSSCWDRGALSSAGTYTVG